MKKDIQPIYEALTVRCGSCGAGFETKSTKKEITVEVCSNCHPHYTGQQRFVDAGGRVDRFRRIQKAAAN